MELPILLLEDALLQQKEQLNDALRRNKDKTAQAYEFRLKAIKNLKCFIAELEEGISVLKNVNKPDEALSLAEVVVTEGEFCGICKQSFDIVAGKICEHEQCVRYR